MCRLLRLGTASATFDVVCRARNDFKQSLLAARRVRAALELHLDVEGVRL
jgi:hypothetical protein